MKIALASVTSIMIAMLTGCSQGTPGGAGTTAEKPSYGQADNTFNLSVPVMASSLQQGDKTETAVGIKRAKNFDGDVTLKFIDLPKGITIEPANAKIKHGDTEAKITFRAGDDAPIGDFKVKITGHPTKGADAEVEFKLDVVAMHNFALSVPYMSTSLKQGETKTVSIGIKREKSFDQDVALKFGNVPTGVTLVPTTPVIKNGDTEARVTLTGANDASLGNFAITVTGHPARGPDASQEFNLTVAK